MFYLFYLTVFKVSLLRALLYRADINNKKEMQSYALQSLHFSYKQVTVTENDK